eukprot:gene17868-biopygen11420
MRGCPHSSPSQPQSTTPPAQPRTCTVAAAISVTIGVRCRGRGRVGTWICTHSEPSGWVGHGHLRTPPPTHYETHLARKSGESPERRQGSSVPLRILRAAPVP